MNVTRRIMELMQERDWTEARLARKCGSPYSTIYNIFCRNSIPSVATLECICNAFGISLSQFFAEGDEAVLIEEQKELLERWKGLSEKQKQAILDLMTEMTK